MMNDFLKEMLTLQQDGKQAISAPTNWTTQIPLLEVTTGIDELVEEISKNILVGDSKNSIARWHFFIGSPGNGKSAAMGKLCRHLLNEQGCKVLDEQGCAIQELEPTAVPYALDIFEGNHAFASARIIQDASVVRNPFSPDVDPARELFLTLEEAWHKGISLIICTNRGVLEKAHRDNHINKEANKTPWFKILSAIVQSENILRGEIEGQRDFTEKKAVFKSLKISYSYLDNRSLLIGSDIFDRLVQKAVHPSYWKPCDSCTAAGLCPFKSNRDWLSDADGRKNVLSVLRRAEALSGQIIVFREAIALISLILSGCPRDYSNNSPCDWVKQKVSSGNLFSLAMRRIYMSLFTTYAPFGLEVSTALYGRQISALATLNGSIGDDGKETKTALSQVLLGVPPSTDVGLIRLLGEEGILAQVDPCREPLRGDFYDFWDGDYSILREFEHPLLTPIERHCVEVWAFLEQVIESTPDHTVFESHWALRRWSSNFLLHLGALLEGTTAWASELDAFLQLIEVLASEPRVRTIEQKRKIRELNEQLETLLETGSSEQHAGTIQLSEAVSLGGRWVKDKLKPRTIASEKTGSLSFSIEFEGGERASLGASMYIWLNRRERGKLDPRCFPPELLTGAMDARVRAASKGRYAFMNDDIELTVRTGDTETFRLFRFDGDVDVGHE
jgi:hypothetical protein